MNKELWILIKKNKRLLKKGKGYYDTNGRYHITYPESVYQDQDGDGTYDNDENVMEYDTPGFGVLKLQNAAMKEILRNIYSDPKLGSGSQIGGLEVGNFVSRVKKQIKKIKEYNVGKVLKNVIFGISDYTPVTRKNLEEYGNKRVVKIQLGRYPIASQGQLEGVLKVNNIWQNGIFNKSSWDASGKEVLNKIGYDKLFHLYSLVWLEGEEDPLIVEKQTTIRIEPNTGSNNKDAIAATRDPPHEKLDVPVGNKSFTLAEMMNKTQKRMGTKDFFGYNSFNTNCQLFLNNMLAVAKLSTPENRQFINQDLAKLAEKLPWWSKFVSDVGTEIEARTTSVQEGGAQDTSLLRF